MARIPALTASGSSLHASTTAARSGSSAVWRAHLVSYLVLSGDGGSVSALFVGVCATDALDLGSSLGNQVEVRVLSAASPENRPPVYLLELELIAKPFQLHRHTLKTWATRRQIRTNRSGRMSDSMTVRTIE